MTDHTSARIFRDVFCHLAACCTEECISIAQSLWLGLDHYDFTDSDLHCDEALIGLGLARRDDDGVVHYNER